MVVLLVLVSLLMSTSAMAETRPAPKSRSATFGVASTSTQAVTGDAVREALDIDPSHFVSADFGSTDPRALAVFTEALSVFPTRDGDFVVMSTGLAEDASLPNLEGNRSTDLDGSVNSQGNDVVQLRLELNPPENAKGLSFDVMFLSEEFPEFVGSQYNDAFTAEMLQSQLEIVGNQVYSPYNFAYDSQGNVLSVNTVFDYTLETGTTFDGATALLTAAAPIERDYETGTGHVFVYLTIQDLGDGIYDSAVFLDNFRWTLDDPTPGLDSYADEDGDGLPDSWEISGVDYDGDGVIDLDLPAMGANPRRKDIFVEIDYMVKAPTVDWFGLKLGGHSHKPKKAALEAVRAAFANAPVSNPDGSTGITIHIDAGPDSLMKPGADWGSRSRSGPVPEVTVLGSMEDNGWYDWTEFEKIKRDNFELSRADVFHYCLFAHDPPLDQDGKEAFGGISRGIPASDFIVMDGGSLGAPEQAACFMHELGHNLGLGHGGDVLCPYNYKPNYLSIMNYTFSWTGLPKSNKEWTIDYSRTWLPDLDEGNLNEMLGLGPTTVLAGYDTIFFRPLLDIPLVGQTYQKVRVSPATAPIDWNGNGSSELGVVLDLNKDGLQRRLTGYDDWANLRFDGGAVGMFNSGLDLPQKTENIERPYEDFVEDGLVLTEYRVDISTESLVHVVPGTGNKTLEFSIENTGENADTYEITAEGFDGAVLDDVPTSVALEPGEREIVRVWMALAPDTELGPVGTVRLTSESTESPSIFDEAQTEVIAIAASGPRSVESVSVEGRDRYETAVAVSVEAYPDGLDPDGGQTVVIATGRNWPDALGGTALAGVLDGPILLTRQDSLPDVTKAEIQRLGAGRAIILGGASAVGSSVESELRSLLGTGSVTRIAGNNRYETANKVAERVIELLGDRYSGTAFVATGGKYPDALAAAPLAAVKGWPLFLARPASGLSAASRAAMEPVTKVLVLGGPGVVSPAVEKALVTAMGADNVRRLAGESRYDTAVKVAEHGVSHMGLAWNEVAIATGEKFPDALAGGVLQGKRRSTMLLTRGTALSSATAEALALKKAEIGSVTFLGSTGAVSKSARDATMQLLQ